MASRVAQAVFSLLEKMSLPDADFRYMALSDLMSEANKDTFSVLDDRTEAVMVQKVLDLVRDANGEVKNMSVRCLGALVKTMRDAQLRLVMDTLVEYVSSKDEELREISSLGLKTVMSEIPAESAQAVAAADKLVPRLLTQLSDASASQESLIDSLDVLTDYFSRFAHVQANEVGLQRNALKSLLAMLSNNRAAVRKRAIQALSALAAFAVSEVFTKLSESIAVALASGRQDAIRTNIQLLGALAKTSPRRLGRRLPEFMPRILTILSSDEAQEDDELREVCLQSLESILLRCPAESTPFVVQIVEQAVELLKHDPNYAGGDDSDDEMTGEDGLEEDDEFLNEETYSDDEDMSWKVRRASAKLLSTVIVTRSELLASLLSVVAPALVARFSEREESVRDEVLYTFASLLRQIRLYGNIPQATEVVSRQSPGALKRKWDTEDMEASTAASALEGSPLSQVAALEPAIAKALAKSCASKAIPTRIASYVVLRELITTLQGGLDEHIGLLVSHTEKALKGTDTASGPSTTIKTEILSFLLLLFRYHDPKYFDPYLDHLVPFIASVINDKIQRETIDGFRVTSQLVIVLRPFGDNDKTAGKYQSHIVTLYEATMNRLNRPDSDQEIKEKGIATLGDLLACAGDDLSDLLDDSLALLVDRLSNETTRLAAVKAIEQVALSPRCPEERIEGYAKQATQVISSLLRKDNRPLRLAAFESLNALLTLLGSKLTEEPAELIVDEIEILINRDANVSILPVAVKVLKQLLDADRALAKIHKSIVPCALNVVRSPLLQGPSLSAELDLIQNLVSKFPTEAKSILAALEKMALEGRRELATSTQSVHVIAQCIAAVVKSAPETGPVLLQGAKSVLSGGEGAKNDSQVYFHLLIVGELARFTNLSEDQSLFDSVLQFYDSSLDEVKSAAAFAVGNMAVGNMDKFLPIIESQLKEESRRFLALNALKELIAHGSPEQLSSLAQRIWTPLFSICETDDEAIRNMGAECLARLTLNEPTHYLAQLQSRLHDPTASTRAAVIAAIRFTLTDANAAYDALLSPCIVDFLSLLKDESLDVRKPAMFAFNAAAHNRPRLIRNHLHVLLPMLYQETVPRQELLRKVPMGPFTVVTDDGLDLRKNAFETMYTLLDTCFSKINLGEYIERVIAGLRDEDGIKVLSSLMLVRLANLAPTHVAQRLDEVVEPITSTLKVKLKDQATKQDVEKSAEIQRALFRAMVACDKTPYTSAPKFRALVRDARESSPLYREVEAAFLANASVQHDASNRMDLDGN